MKGVKNIFIETFNELDDYLNDALNTDSHIGFLRKLNMVKTKNRIIRSEFQFLRTAGDLRNIIQHNNNAAMPTEAFNKKFVEVTRKIIHPNKAYDVMIPLKTIKSGTLDSPIVELRDIMVKHNISTIPILDQNTLIGVFNETTFYNYFKNHNELLLHEATKLDELKEDIKLNNQPSTYYRYIPRNLSVYEVLDLFVNGYENEKKLELLFVTENGKASETVLGLITIWDLKNHMT